MRPFLSGLSLGALALLTLGAALSQQQPPTGLEERFKQLDRNGDGKLTPDELPGEWFTRLDTNK
ncbi:MAG: hypothetical protein KKI08_09775, partial [Armatimonadetes bacterium]|nr:hypothetical protein [Armatimonadota bacterium]